MSVTPSVNCDIKMSEYPWEIKKQNYPRRTPFAAMLQDIF